MDEEVDNAVADTACDILDDLWDSDDDLPLSTFVSTRDNQQDNVDFWGIQHVSCVRTPIYFQLKFGLSDEVEATSVRILMAASLLMSQ